MLELYTENKDIDKVSALKREMEYFNIHIGELKYGLDNTGFVIDKENQCINQSLKTVKFINSQNAEDMVLLREQKLSFPQLIVEIKENTSLNSRQLETLIKLDYFKQFGSIKKCLTFLEYYVRISKKTYKLDKIDKDLEKYFTMGFTSQVVKKEIRINKELWNGKDKIIKETKKGYTIERDVKVASYPLCEKTETMYKNINKEIVLNSIWNDLSDEEFDVIDLMRFSKEYLGYITEIPNDISIGQVEMVSIKNNSANIKSLRTSENRWFKFKKIECSLPKKGETIIIQDMYKKSGWKGRIDSYIKRYEKL